MSRAHADCGEGPWAAADALPASTDYGKLAKLFAPPRRQGQRPCTPCVAATRKAAPGRHAWRAALAFARE